MVNRASKSELWKKLRDQQADKEKHDARTCDFCGIDVEVLGGSSHTETNDHLVDSLRYMFQQFGPYKKKTLWERFKDWFLSLFLMRP